MAAGELGFKSGGVGLQTWTAEQQVKLRTDLLDYLCKAVRDLNERELVEAAGPGTQDTGSASSDTSGTSRARMSVTQPKTKKEMKKDYGEGMG